MLRELQTPGFKIIVDFVNNYHYLYPMPEEKGISIRKIRAFNRYYTDLIGLLDKHLLNSSWSLAEARIIYEIHIAGSVRASQIIEVMHIDRGYLSRLLKKLEKEKLIARQTSSQDARASTITLTAKGQKEFEQLNKASDDQISWLITPLTNARRQELVAHMNAIMEILKKQ
jgi:DNA-binding MarR family transcriptional regulator